MVTPEKEIVFGLLDRAKKEKQRIQELTSNILAIQNNLSPEHIIKIKQNINEIIASLATYCSDELFLYHQQFEAKRIFIRLNDYGNDEKTTALRLNPKYKVEHLVCRLDSFCLEVNTWHPIVFDEKEDKKGRSINLTINLNGIKIG